MPRHRHWDQPRPLDWSGLPSSQSSFIIPIIEDSEFSPNKMVFFVYNHSENNGFGMPGGGVKPEWLENQEQAAIREGTNESGLVIKKLHLIPVPGEKNKLLILDKRTRRLVRWIPYADGRQKSVMIRKSETAVLNPFNIYLADVDWFNSKPRQFLLELRDHHIANGMNKELIARMGLSVNDMTREELLALGVDEEEVDEIGGFALLPISYLRWMWDNKQFCLDLDEDPRERKNNPNRPTTYVYYAHIKRVLEGLDIMGVA